jgi:hypothetical protein
MLAALGMTFHGVPHSGLDDAANIARIAIELMLVSLVHMFLSFSFDLHLCSRMDTRSHSTIDSWIRRTSTTGFSFAIDLLFAQYIRSNKNDMQTPFIMHRQQVCT